MAKSNVQYVPGEVNKDYIVVRNEDTVPAGTASSMWGTRYPGQGEDGYGKKISTDMMLQFKGRKQKYRVYATCYSNAASHWIIRDKKKLHLPLIWQDEVQSSFYEEVQPVAPEAENG